MLDLFIAADLVRQQTKKSLATEVSPERARTPYRPRRRAVRVASAAALRGLAAFIEPSPCDTAELT